MMEQNVITFKQDFYKIIRDKKIAQYFYDENYMMLIRALRKGPMTIEEIMGMYEKEDNEKALKTVYRYIKALQEVGLVVEAGKKIITDEYNKNKSITIFMRSAKVYVDFTTREEDAKKDMLSFAKALAITLKPFFRDKKLNIEKLREVITQIFYDGQEIFADNYKEYEQELTELIDDFDYMDINMFLNTFGWIAMILKYDVKKMITDCYT
ncbi:MAG: hypothetical protein ACFFDW_14245 [Candidatus Thorarchaeota archaeon]